jgi:hypothetical protein
MFFAFDAVSAAIDFAEGNVDDGMVDSPPSQGPVVIPILSPSPLISRTWKVMENNRFPTRVASKEGFAFLTLKICMETRLENFTYKTCYDYFQAYDITLICSLFLRILYFSYMLYYKKNI